MKTPTTLSDFLSQPWAMLPEALESLTLQMVKQASGETATGREAARAARNTAMVGKTAIVPVHGVMTQRGDIFDAMFGGGSVSTAALGSLLRQLAVDDTVSTIVLDIDSPGGSVYGVAELIDNIATVRGKKTLIAVANSLAASAAYWLASAADEIVVTPGGEVGSIGVFMAHVDHSEMLKQAGLQFTVISSGKYKTEANPYQPLSDDAKRFLQSRVDEYYGMFVKAVAANRGATQTAVREGYGQGRVLGAQAALRANLVDRIATLEQVVTSSAALGSKRGSQSRLAASERELRILEAGGSAPNGGAPARQTGGGRPFTRLEAARRTLRLLELG
ncbi:MAG: signal peptide peptidase SppA [Betaproteobacteria bacterium]|nr:signal peptide peptidase SppA [Betaproteobacteria bacterium]